MGQKVTHTEEMLRWHLQNNVHPVLTPEAIDGILETIKKFNAGELSLTDGIRGGAEITVEEMFNDLNIDVVDDEEDDLDFEDEEEEEEEEENKFLESLYHEIDRECLDNTDTVKMSTIKRLFAQYGARESEME